MGEENGESLFNGLMAKLVTIYALSDPRLDRVWENVRYVGKTDNKLHDRLVAHTSKSSGSYKRSWILSIRKEGVDPVIWPLEFCCSENWQEREKWWIAKLRQISRLTNLTDGGDGVLGMKYSPERCAAMSAQRKGWVILPETRRKISAALKGRKKEPFTERQLQLMREAKLGKKHSPEHCEKMRQKMTGRVHTWGHKISESLKKLGPRPPLSEETKRKIGDAHRGRKRPPECVEKIRIANSRPVMCVQTGEVFYGMKATGINNVQRAVRKGTKAGGFNWVYANHAP